MLIPVAVQYKAWVYGRSLAGTVGSNPARGKDVYPLRVLCVLSGTGLLLIWGSPTYMCLNECD
jgi:hypothetical protein